jgi:CheY-like chemotaxis protein
VSTTGQAITIVMADDDADDRMFAKEALTEARLANDLYFVEDGKELMDYLNHRGKYSGGSGSPPPVLILLDLNMPKMDGREALQQIKADPRLRRIPIVVLTTSKAQEDIYRSYDLGASSFITKPVTFKGLVNIMQWLKGYWFEIVELPTNDY